MKVTKDQTDFTSGILDERMLNRFDYQRYNSCAKNIENALVVPQGCVTRRFGTKHLDSVKGSITDYTQVQMTQLIFEEQGEYLYIFRPLAVDVYFANTYVATVVTTYKAEDIQALKFTQAETRLLNFNENYQPASIARTPDSPITITGVDTVNNELDAAAWNFPAVGAIEPIKFTTTGTLPTSTPQIYAGRIYYAREISATAIAVFTTVDDAKANVNRITFATAGTGTNSGVKQNTFSLANLNFQVYPAYDFGEADYSAITFTPSAVSGNAVVLTASSAIFTAAMVGGLFTGRGGALRITVFTDTTHVTGYTTADFDSTTAIEGTRAFLGEPAWSAARGWPSTGTFFQGRLIMGNSTSIRNGIWASKTLNALNFDTSTILADDSWDYYFKNDLSNVVLHIIATRSLIVMTNTGIYSTPIQTDLPITPTTVTFTEQARDGANNVIPAIVDNQTLFVDKSDQALRTLIFDFAKQAYNINALSIIAKTIVEFPQEMVQFADSLAVDGNMIFIINGDGNLVTYQTLINENVQAFTISNTGGILPAKFRHLASTIEECWFCIERYSLSANAGQSITAFNALNATFTVTGHGMGIEVITPVKFATSGSLPITSPQIAVSTYYYAYPVDANTFRVYLTYLDAFNDNNRIAISSIGTNSTVITNTITTNLFIEALDFDVFTDSAIIYNGTPATTITGLGHLNGEIVAIRADGFIHPRKLVSGGQITLDYAASVVEVGLFFAPKLEPLPPVIQTPLGFTFYRPTAIRTMLISYFQTLGLTIQLQNVYYAYLNQIVSNEPTPVQTGITPNEEPMTGFLVGELDLVISQNIPAPWTIRGINLTLEVMP